MEPLSQGAGRVSGSDILCEGAGEPLLFLRLPIVGQREFDIGGKRLLPISKPQEEGLRLVKLLVRQPRGGDVNAGLQTADLLSLPLRFGFGTVREIPADTFSVEPAVDPENDLPAAIREL